MTEQKFANKYLADAKDEPGKELNTLPCPLQSGNACAGYEHRPANCRPFRHLHRPDFVVRLRNAVKNGESRPISFNVHERLKMEFPSWRNTREEDDF